jgi:glycosyltransferase involved in cell wall biosynthesis
MKVLLVNKLYHPETGGAELITQSLAEMHRQHGLDVTVATTADTDTLQHDRVGDIPVVRLPLRNFFWHREPRRRGALARAAWHARDVHNGPMARALEQVIRSVDPDVIAFHNLAGFSASAWAVAHAARKPALQVLHDYYHLCPRSQLFAKGKRCEQRCTSCTLLRMGRREQSNQLQAVVGVSQAVLDAHLSRGLFGDVRLRSVIHNAIVPLPLSAADVPATARAFGFIGAVGDYKGVQPMLEAFQRAHAHDPSLRLRIAGSGDPLYVSELQRRYADPSIEFLGRMPAAEFFRTIDALIVPSLWDDPLPTVVLESISAGVPVIGALRGGIPEMLTPHVNGLLYEPSQAGELEQALLRLAREPELMQTLRAGCAATQSFNDPHAMARAHERVYESMCGASA